jgi:AmmeMemoRadiSam system protein B
LHSRLRKSCVSRRNICCAGARTLIIVTRVVGLKPSTGSLRPPAVAGTFYPEDADACRRAVTQFFDRAVSDAVADADPDAGAPRWRGGVVPHAGWICSGAIAARTIEALARANADAPPDVVVVFGAVHTPVTIAFAALDSHAAWDLPGEPARVAEELGRRLVGTTRGLFLVEDRLHEHEHAVEVELPLVRHAWPGATVLPVEVPPVDGAIDVGLATARAVEALGQRAVYLASSDLTHYGPAYRFAPAGIGPQGLAWAKSNDCRLLERVVAGEAAGVLAEARDNLNACGPGAIAAMLAATGATHGRVLRHASSYETLADVHPQPPTDAVGYAAVVVG